MTGRDFGREHEALEGYKGVVLGLDQQYCHLQGGYEFSQADHSAAGPVWKYFRAASGFQPTLARAVQDP
jgi:hypothetical protein